MFTLFDYYMFNIYVAAAIAIFGGMVIDTYKPRWCLYLSLAVGAMIVVVLMNVRDWLSWQFTYNSLIHIKLDIKGWIFPVILAWGYFSLLVYEMLSLLNAIHYTRVDEKEVAIVLPEEASGFPHPSANLKGILKREYQCATNKYGKVISEWYAYSVCIEMPDGTDLNCAINEPSFNVALRTGRGSLEIAVGLLGWKMVDMYVVSDRVETDCPVCIGQINKRDFYLCR